jgi:hypothetical protein
VWWVRCWQAALVAVWPLLLLLLLVPLRQTLVCALGPAAVWLLGLLQLHLLRAVLLHLHLLPLLCPLLLVLPLLLLLHHRQVLRLTLLLLLLRQWLRLPLQVLLAAPAEQVHPAAVLHLPWLCLLLLHHPPLLSGPQLLLRQLGHQMGCHQPAVLLVVVLLLPRHLPLAAVLLLLFLQRRLAVLLPLLCWQGPQLLHPPQCQHLELLLLLLPARGGVHSQSPHPAPAAAGLAAAAGGPAAAVPAVLHQ